MATTRRLFVTPAQVAVASNTEHVPWDLADDEQHYARAVLRLAPGDAVMLADGAGHEAPGVLVSRGRRDLAVQPTAAFAQAPALAAAAPITVACPWPKGERADWMAEKLAELGVLALVWITCARSVVQPKGSHKPERTLRVMRAAARQARHGRVPALGGPIALADYLAQGSGHVRCWVADAGGVSPKVALAGSAMAPRSLLVGPEGGLTEDELRQAGARGYGRLSLGPHILRMETAALACAILMGQTDL